MIASYKAFDEKEPGTDCCTGPTFIGGQDISAHDTFDVGVAVIMHQRVTSAFMDALSFTAMLGVQLS